LSFCTSRKGCFLFVTDMDPLQLPIAPYRVYYRIEAISDDTIYALYPSMYQMLYKDISDRLTHGSLLLSSIPHMGKDLFLLYEDSGSFLGSE